MELTKKSNLELFLGQHAPVNGKVDTIYNLMVYKVASRLHSDTEGLCLSLARCDRLMANR